MVRLMIVDESDTVRKIGVKILTELDFVVIEASSAMDALCKCEIHLPQVLIVDAAINGALDLISNVRLLPGGNSARVFYCIVTADLKTLMAGKRAGASDFLLKPFDRKILTSVFGNLALAA